MFFFNYSRFLYQWSWQPWYNWNNLERGGSINYINSIQNCYKTNSFYYVFFLILMILIMHVRL
jgi:hypothetical protein